MFCPAVQVFLLGGSFSGGQGNKYGEVFDPITGTWRALTSVKPDFILTGDVAGTYRADNHGWFFGWLDGEGALPLHSVFQGA
jgi:galactose oxidase